MISTETGTAMTYSIFYLQERGQFFIGPQTDVYQGMIVGVSSRDLDMEVNPTKTRKRRPSVQREPMKPCA
jgi:GTP-binding protein